MNFPVFVKIFYKCELTNMFLPSCVLILVAAVIVFRVSINHIWLLLSVTTVRQFAHVSAFSAISKTATAWECA